MNFDKFIEHKSIKVGDIDFDFYLNWYRLASVKFGLIQFLFNREFILLVPYYMNEIRQRRSVRNLRCHSVQHLDYILNQMMKIERKKNIFNFYYSIAKYKNGIPKFSPNLAKRKTQTQTNTHTHTKTIASAIVISRIIIGLLLVMYITENNTPLQCLSESKN